MQIQKRLSYYKEEWHCIPLDELVEKLGTNLEKGITFCHAEHCLSRDGPNKLTPLKEPLRLFHFTRHLRGIILPLMIAVLLCFITATMPDLQPIGSHSLDKVYLGVLLILSTIIVCSFSIIVERKSKQVLESLRDLYPQFAVVLRNGEKWRIRARDIVVGDIVVLKQGDYVPADIRISESTDLETDDSRIIGTLEWRPKNPYNVKPDPLETENLAFFGTYCMRGYGRGICIATGDETVLGQTLDLTVALEKRKTAIYNSIEGLVHFLATMTGGLGIILFICSYHVGWFWLDTALYLLILVIANIPDSLLSGTTASLAISAKRMASHNCLVKDLETVENLGVVTVVCCGKKDVITQNVHTVHYLWLDQRSSPLNLIKREIEFNCITASPGWADFVRAACLCNSNEAQTSITKLNSSKESSGNSLEEATMVFLKKCAVDVSHYRENYTKVFELPYNPNRNKFHVTVHEEATTCEEPNGNYILSVKGAPDIVMSFCSSILVDGEMKPLDKFYLNDFSQTAENLLSKGEVVIGFCDIEVPKSDFPTYFKFEATTIPLKGLRFLGMISFQDPVRPSTIEAIRNFRNAGIKVMLLTGDHPILAKSLATRVGIIGESSETRDELAERLHISVEDVEPGSVQAVVICGDELNALKDAELFELLMAYEEVVFARIMPEQKSRIVKVCQAMHHSVAITGRKFEDCEALKQADIGIAMGKNSCDLCNENANVILLDKSFLTSVTAVKEGNVLPFFTNFDTVQMDNPRSIGVRQPPQVHRLCNDLQTLSDSTFLSATHTAHSSADGRLAHSTHIFRNRHDVYRPKGSGVLFPNRILHHRGHHATVYTHYTENKQRVTAATRNEELCVEFQPIYLSNSRTDCLLRTRAKSFSSYVSIKNDHYVPLPALVEKLGTDLEKGLNSTQARAVLEKDGPNVISIRRGRTFRGMRRMFGPFTVMLLFGGMLAFAAYGLQVYEHYNWQELDYVYSGFILFFISFINAICFMYQHKSQTKTFEKFQIMWPKKACVIRDGERQLIPVSQVVKGDMVEIQAGERLPADIRLVVAHSMTVDNRFITNDSTPVPRNVHTKHKNILRSENMAFLSTQCMDGFGRGIVVATGDRTVVGKIARLTVILDSDIKPPLAYEIRIYDKYVAVFVTLVTAVFCVWVTLGKYSLSDLLINAITTIASNVPEGLIPTIGVILTVMVKRLGKNRCLMKNLMTLDTLGLTSTVILRTKSLTTKEMIVSHLWMDDKIYTVTENEDGPVKAEYLSAKSFSDFSRGAILSNCAESPYKNPENTSVKRQYSEEVDNAILAFMEKTVGNVMEYRRKNERVLSYPFNAKSSYSLRSKASHFERSCRFQVTIHRFTCNDAPSEYVAFIKGSPEILWQRSSSLLLRGGFVEIDENLKEKFWRAFKEFGRLAEIVVGLCDYVLPKEEYGENESFASTSISLPDSGLRFLGMISLLDPPEQDSIETIVKLRQAGIKVLLASGAHDAAAIGIAKKYGFIADDPALKTVEEINSMTRRSINPEECKSVIITREILHSLEAEDLDKLLGSDSELVFTRVTSHQKFMIVDALQRRGETVALVGEGISEAASIKKADIGIALANFGRDTVVESADMVLLDNNLSGILKGIELGRLSYTNIKKSLLLAMSAHVPEMLPFFLNIVAELPMPLMAKAFLCLNIGIDIFPAICIGFEKEEDNIMLREPRRRKDDRLFSFRILFVSYMQYGIWQTMAGYMNNFLIIAEDGFTPDMVFGIKTVWDSKAINDLKDHYNQEWTYYHRKKLEYLGQTAFFSTVVVMQLFNAVMCKTLKNSIFQQGMRNWYLNCSLIFSLLIAVSAVYTPYFDHFFRMVAMPIKLWFVPVPFALWLFAVEEVRKWYMRRLGPGSWLEQISVT
ncbi:Sodium/potassium-transporting ATPase subunit like protein [Argiope bruennichi]|uniref:Sodium/potassium-transporting ATPase subunit like protein n=1 Tax=Argiope bruennichi TaxID=94029 RepID=A0A8T0EPA0_ARGBR|nr:Sodium/potassium-transporting ATPase subunit like protein [Argiope bruennichi]